jgi:hypothetical protein
MIIVKLKGGLGNQLFQYAAGRQLSENQNVSLKLDLSYLQSENPKSRHTKRNFELDKFKIKAEIATEHEIRAIRRQRWKNFFKPIWIKERHDDCYEKFTKAGKTCYLDGFWQSENYFFNISEYIRSELQLKESFTENYFVGIKEQIENSNSVSLHFRRGDYVDNPVINQFHGVCSLDYYQQAVKWMVERMKNPHFFVFSDDIQWVKKNFNSGFPMFFIEKSDEIHHSDFYLMSLCKHNIIANSSYSWWAAWLNANDNKLVITPQKWYLNKKKQSKINGLIPEKWIKI